MSDLDSEIVAARVAGEDEREICIRLGCTMGPIRAAQTESAARMFAPGYVARMRAESLATFDALEQAWAAKAKSGDWESLDLLAQIRRQRARLLRGRA
jgi:hypothetical protein